jgi:EIX receptor 1/2
MIIVMGGRSLKFLYAFLTLLLQLKPALGFSSGVGDGSVRCIERERQALLEFKSNLVDDYGGLSSWGSEDEKKNCCKWKGVHCSNQTGHVLRLDLNGYQNYENQRLRGMISPSLLELSNLTYLDLSVNDFNQNHIPEFICSFNNLKYLDLSSANLSGPIPHQLGNLSDLQYLDLSWNDLKIINNLEWLSHLSSIELLGLSNTSLSVANDWLEVVSRLPKLSGLSLSGCDLPPVTPSSLTPININFSKSLTGLDLSANHLTSSIFSWLFNYSTSLVDLDLHDNQLRGSILDGFGNMNSLQSLVLDDNQIEGGVPKFFGNMCTLYYLSLGGNKLSGQLVELIHNLSGCVQDSLWFLDLHGNQMRGPVPKSIGNLYKLQCLYASSNLLEGDISEHHFSNLSKLVVLSLSYNSLTVKFSSDWVPPLQLDLIELSSCKLGPDFPKWMKTQKNFGSLDISNNGISDTIPMWFWDLPFDLYYLNLSCNQIKGRLPNLSIKFSNIPVFDLSSNNFEGPLPFVSSNLTMLKLSNNKFSGLNSFLCTAVVPFLVYLDLSNNRLSGGLPDCFMQWQELRILNLANNNLSGEIPSSMGSLIWLRALDLGNNSFLGELPSSLRNCTMLLFINLRENLFSGKLPVWIGESILSLVILNLHSNKFHGSIPLQLCHLVQIQFLDLSQNNISGNIPRCLYNLTAMALTNSNDTNVEVATHSLYFDGIQFEFFLGGYFVVDTIVSWKGNSYHYGKNFKEMRSIDLSNNKLTGEIPEEISSLKGLLALNLSRNMLTGLIPQKIGYLTQLESLDLSRNELFGSIPTSMADISFLEVLNLSYNKLSGRIPTGTQIQIADYSGFIGNLALCGPPLTQNCPGDVTPNTESTKGGSKNYQEDEDEFLKCLYFGMGFGFVVGFWGICGSLMLNRSWRHIYFRSLINLKDWLYVTMMVNTARLQRMFHS